MRNKLVIAAGGSGDMVSAFALAQVGARGLVAQLQRTYEAAQIDLAELVDAGGDVLARGDEPGLVSAALDAVTFAACSLITVPALVMVLGERLDGELSQLELAQAKNELPTPFEPHDAPGRGGCHWRRGHPGGHAPGPARPRCGRCSDS